MRSAYCRANPIVRGCQSKWLADLEVEATDSEGEV